MMSKDPDLWLKEYFSLQKQEVEDAGFSRRVMIHLPPRRKSPWLLRCAFLAGLILFCSFVDCRLLFAGFMEFWNTVLRMEIPGMEVLLPPLLLLFLVVMIIRIEFSVEEPVH